MTDKQWWEESPEEFASGFTEEVYQNRKRGTDMTEVHPDFGELYPYSDHKRDEVVTYRNADGHEQRGQIVWVATGGKLPVSGRDMPPHYIVYPEQGGMTDVVFFSDVIM